MKERYDLTKDGFCGRWFPGDPEHVVIVIPGTGTGEENAVRQFAYFHRAGYSMLILAHSVWDGMPSCPSLVPVEYIESAISTLKQNGYSHIALFGISFGARYALLAATVIPEIEVVIAASPYDYITEAVQGMIFAKNCSTHTCRGQAYAYLPMTVLHKNLPLELLRLLRNRNYGIHNLMRYGHNSCIETEAARIPVERITAHVLLMAPADDTCWPSEQAVPRMEALLQSRRATTRAVIYPYGSHILAVDLDATPDRKAKMQRFLKEDSRCDQARRESMEEALAFLQQWRDSSL